MQHLLHPLCIYSSPNFVYCTVTLTRRFTADGHGGWRAGCLSGRVCRDQAKCVSFTVSACACVYGLATRYSRLAIRLERSDAGMQKKRRVRSLHGISEQSARHDRNRLAAAENKRGHSPRCRCPWRRESRNAGQRRIARRHRGHTLLGLDWLSAHLGSGYRNALDLTR